MNNRIKELPILGMYILAFIGQLIIVLSNLEFLWLNLLITLCWLISYTVRNLFIYKTDKYRKYAVLTYMLEILLLFSICIYCGGDSTKLLFCITIADCYIAWNAGYGTLCAVASFIAFSYQFFLNGPMDTKDILMVIVEEAPVFMLVALISYMMGRVIKSNALVEQSMRNTEVREALLNSTYQELSIAYENLEEMSALKERSRIAREIHDNVGHTLTTVIVEMEAGRMLIGKDMTLAVEKFLMAHNQAIKALDELRGSVRLLAKENEQLSLRQAVLKVIEETEKHTGITIKSIIDIPEDINKELVNLIILILKEGLANGIRHGEGTAFFLKLQIENDNLLYLLQDNGKGCSSIISGFGIDNMKKSILNLGGSIEFISEVEEGFEIKLTLPLRRGGEYEINKDFVS